MNFVIKIDPMYTNKAPRVEVCDLCFDRLDQKMVCFDYVRQRKKIRPSSTEEKRFDRVRTRSFFDREE